LVGKTEGKRPRGRSRRRWKDNIMDLKEMGRKKWTGCIWLRIGTKAFVNNVMNLRVP
jgi:hypothetical protein